MLGQKGYSQPYLAPNTTGSVILNGVNYASGGGGILNGTGRIFVSSALPNSQSRTRSSSLKLWCMAEIVLVQVNRLGLDIQLDYFNTTRQQLDELLGKSQAKEYLIKRSIFSVTIGSNDFLNNYLLPVLSARERARLNPDDFINELITNFRSQLIVCFNSLPHPFRHFSWMIFVSTLKKMIKLAETLHSWRAKNRCGKRRADRMHPLPEDSEQSEGEWVCWAAKRACTTIQCPAEGLARWAK